MLDMHAPEPSLHPMVTPFPSAMMEEPTRDVRRFYVKTKDLDPASGGMGFTEGCTGRTAIILNESRVTHDDKCRLRVMDKASVDPPVAARVNVAGAREDEKKL